MLLPKLVMIESTESLEQGGRWCRAHLSSEYSPEFYWFWQASC